MVRAGLALLVLVSFACSTPAQQVTPAAPTVNKLRVKSPLLTPYKDGADVEVKAFLFRYVAPGFKPRLGTSHPRHVHLLVVTNVEPATCESSLFHWDKNKGVLIDLALVDESQFALTLSGHFSDEPEYIYMGEDEFVMLGPGALGVKKEKSSKEPKGELGTADFNKMGRKEQFAFLSKWLEPIWPFRPHTVYVTARTMRGEKKSMSHISSVRSPNIVAVKAEVDKMTFEGEVAVTTCK
jgi:hypothetical protein